MNNCKKGGKIVWKSKNLSTDYNFSNTLFDINQFGLYV